jgi:hypothetical protein
VEGMHRVCNRRGRGLGLIYLCARRNLRPSELRLAKIRCQVTSQYQRGSSVQIEDDFESRRKNTSMKEPPNTIVVSQFLNSTNPVSNGVGTQSQTSHKLGFQPFCIVRGWDSSRPTPTNSPVVLGSQRFGGPTRANPKHRDYVLLHNHVESAVIAHSCLQASDAQRGSL